ncbi:MAG: hypothetical protein WAX04_11795 [Oscillospiraceae bacterium]
MKKKWIILSLTTTCFVITAGIWLGIHAESDRNQKQQQHSKNIQTTIAVVNQDMGAINNGVKENYSAAVIDKLDDGYVLVSAQAAQAGYDQGTYGAIITFSSNLSSHVVSINTEKPEKVNLEFMINAKLPEAKYIESYQRVIDLQYEVNQMISYMYVYSIYDEMHSAQKQVGELFENDTDDMEALNKVKLHNFTQSLDLGDVPNSPLEPNHISFEAFINQVREYADDMSNEYLGSYNKATHEYTVFEGRLVGLVRDINGNSSQWKDQLLVWESKVTDRNNEVENWGKQMNEWLVLAKLWSKGNEDWQAALEKYKGEALTYYGSVIEFLNRVSQWRTDAQIWGNKIKTIQADRETDIRVALVEYNDNYAKINTYEEALQSWQKDLEEYVASLNKDEPLPPKEDLPGDVDPPLPPKEDLPGDVKPPLPPKEDLPGDVDPPLPPKEDLPGDVKPPLPPKENLPGDVDPPLPPKEDLPGDVEPPLPPKEDLPGDVEPPLPPKEDLPGDVEPPLPPKEDPPPPELVLPDDFKLPPKLETVVPWVDEAFDNCPDLEAVGNIDAKIPIPPDFENKLELPEMPKFPLKEQLIIPQRPEELNYALKEIEDRTHNYNPSNYLTSEVKSKAYSYVNKYSSHLYTVEKELNLNQESNTALLNQAYIGYNKYVFDLKNSAIDCHVTEQKNLQQGLNIFYTAKTASSKENKQLLGFFSSMMPNSRIDSVINKDVVEFTIAPVDFVNTNIRTPQIMNGYEQVDLIKMTEIVMLCFFIMICFVLLYILLSFQFSRKKDVEDI